MQLTRAVQSVQVFAEARVANAETCKIKALIVCKSFSQFGQINYSVSTNIILIFAKAWAAKADVKIKTFMVARKDGRLQIHFTIWTNTFFIFDKYNLQI